MNPKMAASPQLFIIINLIIVFPTSITAQQHESSNRNVMPGSSIVATAGAPTWTSPSGEFAFGFKQVAGGGFLLAIWFDRLPEKTQVWSANRDKPASSGSKVQLSQQGKLELIDEKGQQAWVGRSQPGPVAYAAMLNTGNFIVATNASTPLWQSFDEPTDTLLPRQILKSVLVSSFSQTNYSRGRFKLTIGGDYVRLYTRNFPWDDSVYPYWWESGSQLIFNRTGNAYVAATNGTLIKSIFDGGVVPVENILQRLTLEYDGVLRHYVYPKTANRSGGRAVAWSVHAFVPPNICIGIMSFNDGGISGGNGGGICGFNSLCSVGTSPDGPTLCECPNGFSLIDPTDRLSGCRPEFELQSCDPQSQGAELFELTEFRNTNFPYSDYSNYAPVDEDRCRQDCLADCFCALVAYDSTDSRCWKKQLPLIHGRTDPTVGYKSLIKTRKNLTIGVAKPLRIRRSRSSTALVITGSVSMGCSVLLFLISSVFCYNRRSTAPAARAHPAGVTTMRCFGFDELQEATNGFKEELGRGACSIVYKGELRYEEKVIAVKKLNTFAEEANVEFIAEVSSISRTNHKNLAQLLGYCDEGQNRILVYEFMRNGSLATFLFQKHSPRPSWYTRVQIAYAVAKGICYLHEDCIIPIIHCDIKPQNVLLDESFTPKIADFGLAKLMKTDQTRTTTGIRGTKGYVAPEWFRNMAITVKVDVYSFGIMLLELLCCRRSYDADVENEAEAVLSDWAYDCYREGALDLLVVGDEEAKSDMKTFEVFVKTAIWCIHEDPSMRPHMKRVMHMLEGSIPVPAPPDPTTFIN